MADKLPEDEIGKKLELADNWLTKLGVIWKKHWGKLIIIGSIAGVYYFMKWAMSLPQENENEYPQEQVEQAQEIDSSAYWAYWDSVYVADSLRAQEEAEQQ
jgi:hypothetical protein